MNAVDKLAKQREDMRLLIQMLPYRRNKRVRSEHEGKHHIVITEGSD